MKKNFSQPEVVLLSNLQNVGGKDKDVMNMRLMDDWSLEKLTKHRLTNPLKLRNYFSIKGRPIFIDIFKKLYQIYFPLKKK